MYSHQRISKRKKHLHQNHETYIYIYVSYETFFNPDTSFGAPSLLQHAADTIRCKSTRTRERSKYMEDRTKAIKNGDVLIAKGPETW